MTRQHLENRISELEDIVSMAEDLSALAVTDEQANYYADMAIEAEHERARLDADLDRLVFVA